MFGENKKSLPIVNSLIIGVTTTAVITFLHYEEFNNVNNFIGEMIVAFLSSFSSVHEDIFNVEFSMRFAL